MAEKPINFWTVKTYREVGLEAKWSRTSAGRPCVVIRNPSAKLAHQRQNWWLVDRMMADAMQHHGIVDGFDQVTLFGDVFSVSI